MRVSWRFILALPFGVLLGIGMFVGLLYMQLGVPTYSSSWAYEIIQKKEALAAAIPGPRLLLVGGSSTLFGLDGRVIEEQTGCRTVNLGSHAGLGLRYLLYRAQKTVRPGDTVLLALEYEFYSPQFNYDVYDDYILARDPDYFRHMSLLEKFDMATRIPFKRIQKGWSIRQAPEKVRPHAVYADTINEYGDEVANVAANRPKPGPGMQALAEDLIQGIPSDRTPGFSALKLFLSWAKARHITVLATFPNIIYHPEYDGPEAQTTIKTITDFYASQGVSVVGTAREVMLPFDQFFNTPYHLTREAVVTRTERLVPELKPYLNSSK